MKHENDQLKLYIDELKAENEALRERISKLEKPIEVSPFHRLGTIRSFLGSWWIEIPRKHTDDVESLQVAIAAFGAAMDKYRKSQELLEDVNDEA